MWIEFALYFIGYWGRVLREYVEKVQLDDNYNGCSKHILTY